MMQLISFGEDAWTLTFPRRVTPLADEWLSGLLLRCDEMNDWPSGATNAYLLRNSTYNASQSTRHVLIPPLWLLEDLSELLAVPLQLLRTTTYLPELTQIYHLSKLPYSTLLNSSFSFRFCPECTRSRVFRRALMLAHLPCCPLHRLAWCQQCSCGTPQRLFCLQAQPFTCHRCSLDWADFPQFTVSPEELLLSNELLKWYEVFFSRGTPALFSSAMRLIRHRFTQKGAGGVRLLDGKTRFVFPDDRGQISLGYLVDWLVSLELSPSDLAMEVL
jgi:hypothetical protein